MKNTNSGSMGIDRLDRLPDGRTFDFWERPCAYERELYVDAGAASASDDNDGSAAAPFRTIGRAAKAATPGTRVRIHAGIYRECVRPAMGGTDPEHVISYEAFGDGPAVIRASEVVTDAALGGAGRCLVAHMAAHPRPGHVPGLQSLLCGEHPPRPAVH